MVDLTDFENDSNIKTKLLNFKSSVDKIEDKLNNLLINFEEYEKLSLYDKVQYDIFTTYSLNTLFWLYLRTKGVDPNENEVKNELGRIRQYMVKAKQANDRNTIRPVIDKGAAGRFIKHGIKYKDVTTKTINEEKCNEPPSKRQKFD